MKKLIPCPQVVLGMAMNFGTLLGSPAVLGFSDWSVCLPLYFGGICWTVVYDTIYAYQVFIMEISFFNYLS
jgi:4-hydroxybenzoate polyprenyltransferase